MGAPTGVESGEQINPRVWAERIVLAMDFDNYDFEFNVKVVEVFVRMIQATPRAGGEASKADAVGREP